MYPKPVDSHKKNVCYSCSITFSLYNQTNLKLSTIPQILTLIKNTLVTFRVLIYALDYLNTLARLYTRDVRVTFLRWLSHVKLKAKGLAD